MKRTILIILSAILVLTLFAGCAGGGSSSTATAGASQPSAPQPTQTKEQQIVAPQSTPSPQSTASAQPTAAPQSTNAEPPYSFELEDVDGNVHKLSDYSGKPVYLEIWGTWCSVCMSSLPDLEAFAGEQHDFTVLSAVFPGASGEKNKEDFISWYKDRGYKNLTVLLDEKWQIINDFGVTAYPSVIIFDGNGVPVTGFAGLMPKDKILEVMQQVADGTYQR